MFAGFLRTEHSMAGSQMAAPSHLSFRLQGQGLQSVQMMNINRNSKVNFKVKEIA